MAATISPAGKDDTQFMATDDSEKCNQETKSDEDSSIKPNSKRSDNTIDRSLRSLAHLKQSFRPFSTPKKFSEKKPIDKDKNEPSKFFGDGVTFKAKLIGILEVEDARGDRMCQEALNELKMAVRAAGEHKQRINIVISIEGLRLRDEKTGDCLYHHPVHKISFIAQDVADSRAFGYIFGSPDTGHKFFGIKTDKSASQVVIAMRDLFQVVFELKKREVEVAKHSIEQHQLKYGASYLVDIAKAGIDFPFKPRPPIKEDNTPNIVVNKTLTGTLKNKTQTAGVIADLMDLELELNSLQQGLSQMERITPSDPFGSSTSASKDDPFGDSFTPPVARTPPPAKLPPPPTSGDRKKATAASSSSSMQSELHWFDKETQKLFDNDISSPSVQSASSTKQKTEDGQQQAVENSTYKASKDLFDIFTELDPLGTGKIKPYVDKKDFFQELKNPPKKTLKDLGGSENDGEVAGNGCAVNFSASIENNSGETTTGTGTGKINFQNNLNDSSVSVIKEETKIQNNLIADSNSFQPTFADFTAFENLTQPSHEKTPMKFPLMQSDSSSSQSSGHGLLKSSTIVSEKSAQNVTTEYHIPSSLNSVAPNSLSSTADGNKHYWRPSSANNNSSGKEKIVINLRRVLSAGDDTDKENDSPVREDGIVLRNPDAISPAPVMASSDSFESIPEPPPRPITSPVSMQQPPPPLPPKKVHVPVTMKPPARPPSSSETVSHYDYIENYESLTGSKQKFNNQNDDRSNMKIPPIPAPARKSRFSYDSDLDIARKRPQQQQHHHHQKLASCSSSSTEYYLTPISSKKELKRADFENNADDSKVAMPPLDMTLKQLTCADFNEIAAILGIDANLLPRMTLKDLADRLSASSQPSSSGCTDKENFAGNSRRSKRKTGDSYTSLKESFDDEFVPPISFQQCTDKKLVKEFTDSREHGSKMDKYAVFRELMEQEEKTPTTTGAPQVSENSVTVDSTAASIEQVNNGSSVDRYAALRDICPSPAIESNENETIEDDANENVDKNEDDNSLKGSDRGNDFNNEEEDEVEEEEEEEDVIAPTNGSTSEPNKDMEKITERIDGVSMREVAVKQRSQSTENVEANAVTKETNEKEEESSLPSIEREDNSFSKNWTKFESSFVELSPSFEQKPASPWTSENAVVEKSFGGYSPEEEVRKRMSEMRMKTRYRHHKQQQQQQQRWNDNNYYNDDDEDEDDYDDDEDYGDDDSEENWESSRRSLASSWDESSWKENGWSDRDSLYEERATASPTFRAANHRNRYQIRRKGACRRKRYSPTQQHAPPPPPPPPPVATRKQFSPWADEDKNQLTMGTGKTYKMQSKYKSGSGTQSSSWYNSRKVVSPPFYRHSPPPLTEEEQFEILKMMLGKKRFKELGGKIFKKYLTNELASSPYMAKNDDYNEYGESTVRTKSKSGRKYYHLNRPKSAENKTSVTGRRQQCSPSEDLYQGLKYRKPPYSHDELSVSEDEDKRQWRRKHPPAPYYCDTRVPTASNRSSAREHNQTSPFEDNFSPPPDCLPSSSYDKSSATHHRHNIGSSLFTLRLCSPESPASSTNARHHYSGKDLYPPPQPASSSSCYSPQHELKLSRSSRGSSQRQSPFEDDFSSPEVTAQQRIKDVGSTTKRHNADSVNPTGGACSNVPAYSISAEQQQQAPVRNARSNDVFCRMSPPQQEWLKQHYENVDIKIQSPEMFYYDKPTRTHPGKESSRYKSFVGSAVASIPSSKELENDGASPKKFSAITRKQQHISNPFNDSPHHVSGHSQPYESKTVPKSQKMKIKQTKLPSDYDSGSDSVGMTSHPPTVAATKWKEDFSSAFNFPDHQRNK